LALKIVSKQKSTGKQVRYGFIGEYHKGYIRLEDNREIPEADVEFRQILPDGKEEPVQKFPRTKTMEVIRYIDVNNVDRYLIESRYEIWAENIPALWRFCDWLQQHDKAAVIRFTFGKAEGQPLMPRLPSRRVMACYIHTSKRESSFSLWI